MPTNKTVLSLAEGESNQIQIISFITQVMDLYGVKPAVSGGMLPIAEGCLLQDSEVNGIVGWFATTYNRPPYED